jgi:hypothetical protein
MVFTDKITPTPWEIDGDRGVLYGIAPADNGMVEIAQLLHDSTDNDDAERCAQDAALLKFAPKLYAALTWLVDDCADAGDGHNPETGEAYDSHAFAVEVLAQVRGEKL